MTELESLLRERRNVLLDFDGPVCAVFSAITDRAVAEELADIAGGANLPRTVRVSNDPFDVLRYVAAEGDKATLSRVESRFRDLECRAVENAEPTPGAAEAITELSARSYQVAIVTNNSAEAADRYLRRLGLRSKVGPIAGRPGAEVALLKPDPHLVEVGLRELGTTAAGAMFVGDSESDVAAGRAAGVACVALANKPGKVKRFAALRPEATITTMFELLDCLADSPRP
ncbi:HAD family hydrolase [Nocardia sp. NPDC057272]|uniref:HAD family hydrolase n=1 Tax=Nocardia sp. NPDC057272 TaxID=3346079 RepID=UPI00362CEFFE